MSGYTIVNLKEVTDQAPRFGLSPGLESRFARAPLELEHSGITYFFGAPNTDNRDAEMVPGWWSD
jgi:hypothetical protein